MPSCNGTAPAKVAEGEQLPPIRCNDAAGVQLAGPAHRAHGFQTAVGELQPPAAAEPGEDGDAALGRDQQAGAEATHVEPSQVARSGGELNLSLVAKSALPRESISAAIALLVRPHH